MEAESIKLKSLIGTHVLSGAFFDATTISGENAVVLRFTLDGYHYEAVEDPNDGYRSGLGELRKVEQAPENKFKPVNVTLCMSDNVHDEVLQFLNSETGKVIIEIGTSDMDDYYPGFVGYFSPENL